MKSNDIQKDSLKRILDDSIDAMNCFGCIPTIKDCHACFIEKQAEYLYKHGVRVNKLTNGKKEKLL